MSASAPFMDVVHLLERRLVPERGRTEVNTVPCPHHEVLDKGQAPADAARRDLCSVYTRSPTTSTRKISYVCSLPYTLPRLLTLIVQCPWNTESFGLGGKGGVD